MCLDVIISNHFDLQLLFWRVQNWKIFETARAAKKAASKSSRESSVRMSTSASSSMQDPNSLNPSNVPSNAPSDNESFHSDGYNGDLDSLYGWVFHYSNYVYSLY